MWLLSVSGVALIVLAAISAVGLYQRGPVTAATSTSSPATTAPPATASPSPTPTAATDISFTLPDAGASVVIFGDSWTKGYAANPEANGYAYLVGDAFDWQTEVLGESGTGYVNPGPPAQTFVDRSSNLSTDDGVELVIIQGSINDAFIDSAKYPQASLSELAKNAAATIENLRSAYPKAQIVALGPTPPYLPATDRIVSASGILRDVYTAAGLPFVETLGWVTTENIADVIDTDAENHPSTEGHAYLAGKVEEALRALAQS